VRHNFSKKDYRIKSGKNIPIEKLPLPVAGNVPRVVKRIRFCG